MSGSSVVALDETTTNEVKLSQPTMPDGRYRMYVTALFEDETGQMREHIVTAATRLP